MYVSMVPASLELASAFLCAYAYDDGGAGPSVFRPDCNYAWKWPEVSLEMSDWKRFCCAETDVQVLFAYRESDRTVFVAFRGTDSWKDALLDAAVIKKTLPFMRDTDPNARVHAGFFAQYRAAVGAVNEYLARHPGRSQTVVTGHSLGGAVATLCAALLEDELGEGRCRCYVFGCPRVGNSAFVSRVDEVLDLRRFVVGYDPVVNVPTRIRWRHAGKRVWYINGRRVKAGSGDPWTNVASLPNPFCAQDHKIASYIDSVAGGGAGGVEAGDGAVQSWWSASANGIYLAGLAALGVMSAWLCD